MDFGMWISDFGMQGIDCQYIAFRNPKSEIRNRNYIFQYENAKSAFT
jgi:hypothetical protein